MTKTNTSGAADLPEALRIAAALEYCDANVAREAINELRRLHALTAQAPSQPGGFDAGDMASAAAQGFRDGLAAAQADSAEPAVHVQNPAENEHVAGDVSKNGAEANMRGAAYAPMPRAAYIEFDGQEETAWPTPDQMRALADRTHALRMEQAAPKAARAA